MKKADLTYERKLRKNRIAERKKRREAQKISEKFCRLRDIEKKGAMQSATSIMKKHIKKSKLEQMAAWIKGAPERKILRAVRHRDWLDNRYIEMAEKYRIDNNFTKDSVIKYDPKKKDFLVVKGKVKNRAKLKV